MSDRVMLNVKVPKEIKEVYDFIIRKNHGFKDPYAGFELEKELRVAFGMGKDSAMYDHLREIVDNPVEKKNLKDRPLSPGDVMVQYKVHPNVRAELERFKKEDNRTMGEIVANVMYRFAMGDGYQERNRKRAKQAKEEATKKNDDLSTKERRTRDIAEYLKENHDNAFRIEDFNEAVESVPNISASDHVRGKYLKPVLERLGASPLANGVFAKGPHRCDPRGLPSEARNKQETKTAVKTELFANPSRVNGNLRYINRNDVKSVLGTGPRKAKEVMESVANTEGGIRLLDKDGPVLVANMNEVVEWDQDHKDALKLAGLLEENEPEGEDIQDPTEANTQRAGVIAD